MPVLTKVMHFWLQFKRLLHTRYYAWQMGMAHHQIDISGPCHIHGGGNFEIGSNIIIRSTPQQPVELYCASGATLTLKDGYFINQGVHIACRLAVIIGEQA